MGDDEINDLAEDLKLKVGKIVEMSIGFENNISNTERWSIIVKLINEGIAKVLDNVMNEDGQNTKTIEAKDKLRSIVEKHAEHCFEELIKKSI